MTFHLLNVNREECQIIWKGINVTEKDVSWDYQHQERNRQKCVCTVNFMIDMDGKTSLRLNIQNVGSTFEEMFLSKYFM